MYPNEMPYQNSIISGAHFWSLSEQDLFRLHVGAHMTEWILLHSHFYLPKNHPHKHQGEGFYPTWLAQRLAFYMQGYLLCVWLLRNTHSIPASEPAPEVQQKPVVPNLFSTATHFLGTRTSQKIIHISIRLLQNIALCPPPYSNATVLYQSVVAATIKNLVTP